jgi:hypothetical protein
VVFDSVCEVLSLYAGVSVFDAPLEWTGVAQDTIDAVVLDAASRAACAMTFEFGFVYHPPLKLKAPGAAWNETQAPPL